MVFQKLQSRSLATVLTLLLLGGCAAIGAIQLAQLYGESAPRDRQVEQLRPGQIDYWHEVKPILEQRCVVCHGCYDAPCQLKLGAIEGIDRGATSMLVYDKTRLLAVEPTRLFEDAQTTSAWRTRGFFPVLNEYEQSPQANRQAGVMYRMLELKKHHPLPAAKQLGDEFELDMGRSYSCPKAENFDEYARRYPLWGMPYALPGLSVTEQQVVQTWLEQGAAYTPRQPLAKAILSTIDRWEALLNQESLKSQLISRYIYEHLFLAHLYFEQDSERVDDTVYFRLVRSATPPGEPIRMIPTRRPYDDPGIERVYYRLQQDPSATIAKTHMPYALDHKRMQHWRELFFEREFSVTQLPDYLPEDASNPFATFAAIPISSRYRFMLDEAQYTVMGFIKGPVCRGQVALSVINDHFWVFFTNPDDIHDAELAEFFAKNSSLLQLPSEKGSTVMPLASWIHYSKLQREYLQKKDHYIANSLAPRIKRDTSYFWDGDGYNDNAALTIFRHNDSATVEKGLLGDKPKTAWLMSYSNLEQIHYLLVAGYDVYGNVGHQVLSRLYMDFLRMDAETNFLLFLPKEARDRERAYWYREADPQLVDYLSAPEFEKEYPNPDIVYRTDNPKAELYDLLQQRLHKVLPVERNLDSLANRFVAQMLNRLNYYRGDQITFMPEIALLLVETKTGDEFFTILRNNAHLNITSMLREQNNRVPKEDSLLVLRGFIGSYPNVFYKVDESHLHEFVARLGRLSDTESYSTFMDDFGVRRTDPQFWQHSDRVHRGYQQSEPRAYGLLDYNRLENR